jgi:hypothetical protein
MASAPGVRYTHRNLATHRNQHHAIFRAPQKKRGTKKVTKKRTTKKSEARKSYEKVTKK